MKLSDIPKVRVVDKSGRTVCEGYYFEYEAYMPYPMYDGEPPPPPPRVHSVIVAEPTDFGLPPNLQIYRVNLPNRIQVIEPAQGKSND